MLGGWGVGVSSWWWVMIKQTPPGTYQAVEVGVVAEEGLPLELLVVDEGLDVDVEAVGRGRGVGRQRGLLALLKQQRHQREQRVSETHTME